MKTSLVQYILPAFASFCLALTADAAVVLEYNFDNYDSGNQQTVAEQVRVGVSGVGQVTGSFSTVNTAGAAVNTTGVVSKIRTGYLEVATWNSGSNGMYTPNAGFNDYAGGNSYGSGTIEIVYKPLFANGSNNIDPSFWGVRTGHTPSGLSMFYERGANASTEYFSARANGTTISATTPTGSPTLDINTWYYLSMSYSEGQVVNAYWRVLYNGTTVDPDGTGAFASSSGTILSGDASNFAGQVGIGASLNTPTYVSNTFSRAMNGQMAMFRWTDGYTSTIAGFDAGFQALVVPEPSSIALAALGCGVIALRSRRKRKA